MAPSPHRFRPPLLGELVVSGERFPVPLLVDPGPVPSLPADVPAAGRLRVRDVDLGPGRPAVARPSSILAGPASDPALWLTDDDVADAATTWRHLVTHFPLTGLWPLALTSLGGDLSHRPWASGELEPVGLDEVDALCPDDVLAEGWGDSLVPIGPDPYVDHLRPFGAEFPGLSAPLPRAAVPMTAPVGAVGLPLGTRMGLVPCRRPADAIAAIGWQGAINRRPAAHLVAVLRSWEERFGVVLVGLGFATLTLLLPRPPADESEALPIAAELAALCPDVLSYDGPVDGFGYSAGGSLTGLARLLVGRPAWKLWWD